MKLKCAVIILLLLIGPFYSAANDSSNNNTPSYYHPYLDFLEEVFQAFEAEYHYPVSREMYKNYRQIYKDSILSQIPPIDQRIDEVAYRGAGIMIEQMRHPDDEFTNFIPPQMAEEFTREAYGHYQDIGITGKLTEKGYLIQKVERRSDSWKQGIRAEQFIIKVEAKDVLKMSPEEIKTKLRPEIDTKINLTIWDKEIDKISEYKILSKEYYRETVESISTDVTGVYCLKIDSFNRKTTQDLKRILEKIKKNKINFLIFDIRGNPGGPPLAIQEISGIFLPADSKLAFYQKRNQLVAGLIAPSSEITYDGPLAVLVDIE